MKHKVSLGTRFSSFILVLTCATLGVVPLALAATSTYRCTLADVVVFSNHVHVQCVEATTDGTSSIKYFAVPTTDSALANRLMTLGSTALVSGRRFIVSYTAGDTSGSAWGCGANDCRRLTSFGIE